MKVQMILLVGAVVSAFVLNATLSKQAEGGCWAVTEPYPCCQNQPVGANDCNGQYCAPIYVHNEDVRKPMVVPQGWSLLALSRDVQKRCHVYLGICDMTQPPPTCIVGTTVTFFADCSSYLNPTGHYTCVDIGG